MSNQQKGPNDDAIMFFIVIGLIFGLSWVIWTVFHLELTNAVRWIRFAEMYVVSFFVDSNYAVTHERYGTQELSSWLNALPDADVNDISVDHIKMMTLLATAPLKLVFVGLLAAMSLWSLFYGPGTRYKRHMGIDGLIAEQAKTFPVISPFVEFNPTKMKFRVPGEAVPLKLPLFSEALAPEEWVAHHQIPFVGGKLDFVKSYEALAKQLGPRWRGPLKLPIHAQGIFAACALKHARKRDECVTMLNNLALSWSPKKGFKPSSKLRSEIKKVINDPKLGKKLSKHLGKHAYQTTAMLKALSRARQEGGVIASAEFVWLRGHDRTLWYPLNNLGRKAYHAEAAGAMAHYTYELIADQKIPSPKFEDAISNIEGCLKGKAGRRIPEVIDA